jgi:hypothetical protein
MKRARLYTVIIALVSIFVVLNPAVAEAGWVNGYTKSDGTYVNGYWRSDPNGLKYDNYSFDGDWSDAFNDSYYSPTKNYSSDWYTPSWITQDDYYVGKSFYDARKSYTSYSNNLFDYDYDFWDDPIYSYKPSYNYGYNYLDSFSSYKSSYFDEDDYYSIYKPFSSHSSSSYGTYKPYSSYNSLYDYSTPSYNSYSSPSYNYSTPTYNSYSTPSYTSPSYSSYGSTCYYYC